MYEYESVVLRQNTPTLKTASASNLSLSNITAGHASITGAVLGNVLSVLSLPVELFSLKT